VIEEAFAHHFKYENSYGLNAALRMRARRKTIDRNLAWEASAWANFAQEMNKLIEICNVHVVERNQLLRTLRKHVAVLDAMRAERVELDAQYEAAEKRPAARERPGRRDLADARQRLEAVISDVKWGDFSSAQGRIQPVA